MRFISGACLPMILLLGSGCTVTTIVDVLAPPSTALTGTQCKLQRELRNQEQKTDFWCWAASAHTVIEYLRQEPIKQCSIVDAVLRNKLDAEWRTKVGGAPPGDPILLQPPPSCCMSTIESDLPTEQANVKIARDVCWSNGWPEYVFSTDEFRMSFEGYQYDWSIPYPHGLSWVEIVTEICEDRPMIAGVLFSPEIGGGAHTVVIGGYSEFEDGSQWVHVYDPGFNTLEDDYYVMPYDVYLGDPGVFTHVRDYKNISLP